MASGDDGLKDYPSSNMFVIECKVNQNDIINKIFSTLYHQITHIIDICIKIRRICYNMINKAACFIRMSHMCMQTVEGCMVCDKESLHP